MTKVWEMLHWTHLYWVPVACQALYWLLGMSQLMMYHPWLEALHLVWEIATSTLTRTRCDRWCASSGRKCKANQLKEGSIPLGKWEGLQTRTSHWVPNVLSPPVNSRWTTLRWAVSPWSQSLHSCRRDSLNPRSQGNTWGKCKFW